MNWCSCLFFPFFFFYFIIHIVDPRKIASGLLNSGLARIPAIKAFYSQLGMEITNTLRAPTDGIKM
jgi:hypothetical protein